MDEETLYHIGFSHCLHIGPVRFAVLCSYFESVKKAYIANESTLASLIGLKTASRFCLFRKTFQLRRALKHIEENRITVLTQQSAGYPSYVKEISDPPICLYVRGDINRFDFERDILFGIVGTRVPTSYGEFITAKFSGELSERGLVIVSGMALGIDAIAHQAAIKAGGRTIAVLGCGVDVVYPQANTRLYHEIIDGGGIVVSEFPPGERARREFFVIRNRLISGFSKGLLVIEGAKKSGTLITAKYAAQQGKDVFAPPVPLTSYLCEAPSYLLKQGAKLVTGVDDILSELNITPVKKCAVAIPLTDDEKKVLLALSHEAKTVDELVRQEGEQVSILSYILSSLELKGVIEKTPDGKYQGVGNS